ncbi:MAG: endonuclease [Candidatus Thiodiazotropha sp. LLP2]
MNSLKASLEALFQQLFAHYGAQHWWPAETQFEVMLGAVLTQNTAWSNVEKAIQNLKSTCELNCESLLALPTEQLAQAIRPSGYYNLKTERLLHLCRFLQANSDLKTWDDQLLRQQFLSVHGIGPETADDILLYAFQRPVFVIDAYTRRLFGRLGLVDAGLAYEKLRKTIEQTLDADAGYYNEFHALIVIHAKSVCQTHPKCEVCPLGSICDYETKSN